MTLLIIREEIICIVILLFFIYYNAIHTVKGNNNSFMRLLTFGLGHVVFDMITVITVNNMDVIPDYINLAMHYIFYVFGILFIMEFYRYVLHLTLSRKLLHKLQLLGYIPIITFLICVLIMPMEYRVGRGTNYSYGPLTFASYGILVAYCIVATVVVIVNRQKLENKIKFTVIPMAVMMSVAISIQALIPELLMTGGGVTFVCTGCSVVVSNPLEKYMKQAYWDSTMGIKNKNGYQKDLEDIKNKYLNRKKKITIGFIVGDMNGLKVINDNYGHSAGDKMLNAAATVLLNNLKTAHNIYRTGGDEFAVIYINPNDNAVKSEIEEVRKACEKYTDGPIMLSIALGYASGDYSEDITGIYSIADQLMYEDKTEIKKNHPELIGR